MEKNEDIRLLVPQRAPMLMIDRLLYCDEKIARTVLQISKGNIFVEHGNNSMPYMLFFRIFNLLYHNLIYNTFLKLPRLLIVHLPLLAFYLLLIY